MSSRQRSKSPVRSRSPSSPLRSREDKRITRMHQMEMMEAAARGTAPTMQLDTSSFDVDLTQPESSTFERTSLVAGDFVSSISSQPPTPPRPELAGRGTSAPTNFFAQRERYQVDQTINLMDTSSTRYSASDLETRRGRGSTSFVDIFLGGNGNTSGSSITSTRRNSVKTSWKTSCMGRCLIAFVFVGFMTLLTLSVSFFVSDNDDNGHDAEHTQIRTPAPTFQDVKVDGTREHVHFNTNAAATGPATFANVDYDTKVENTERLDEIQSTLLQKEAATVERLEDQTSSAFHAMRWLTDDDPLQMQADDPALLTRFALASFFYATHLPTQTSTQRQALNEKSADIVTTQWTRENAWMTESNVCEWYGVDCERVQEGSDEPTHVVHLNVTSNGLRGAIPPELKLLSKLVLLDLLDNELSGTIPPELGTLDQIKYLLLQKNSLSGPIPEELEGMAAAYEIDLSNNQLTGGMPDTFGKLDNLRALYLSSNKLTGSIESVTELKDINKLHLEDNAFDGPLPVAIGRLTMLNDLRLINNKLTGTLPPEMANNAKLRLLTLANNHLSGAIPDMFDDLHKLTDLQLHGNRFKSKLPKSMGALTSLRRLTLEGNVMTGRLPSEWGKMTDLEALELFHNEIIGSIPTEWGQMSNLHDLELNHNFLQGAIPSELGQLTRLKHLALQRNALKGAVPAELGNLKSLEKLELAETMVSGTVPDEICELNLQVLEADCKSKIECSCCSKCL